MSYTPTNWDNGDIITAEKLNKIEQGISDISNSSGGGDTGGTFVVEVVQEEGSRARLTATWNELKAAYDAGKVIFMQLTETVEEGGPTITSWGYSLLNYLGTNGEWWGADFASTDTWLAESPNEYLHSGAQ